MTWYVQMFRTLQDLVLFMNTEGIALADAMPVFQDNNGKYILIYQA